jgi:hypothetical protein
MSRHPKFLALSDTRVKSFCVHLFDRRLRASLSRFKPTLARRSAWRVVLVLFRFLSDRDRSFICALDSTITRVSAGLAWAVYCVVEREIHWLPCGVTLSRHNNLQWNNDIEFMTASLGAHLMLPKLIRGLCCSPSHSSSSVCYLTLCVAIYVSQAWTIICIGRRGFRCRELFSTAVVGVLLKPCRCQHPELRPRNVLRARLLRRPVRLYGQDH